MYLFMKNHCNTKLYVNIFKIHSRKINKHKNKSNKHEETPNKYK